MVRICNWPFPCTWSANVSSQIPKPNETEGLGIRWPQQKTDMDALKALCEEIKAKM